jgi:hypothetical protein
MTKFRVANEFAAVDVELHPVPWGTALAITDARTGVTILLDALEVEALTTMDRRDREVLVNRSAGNLKREHRPRPPGASDERFDDDLTFDGGLT